ncbi:MAG: dTDP-4-dehydrorhamnose 3,5-epimerase [Nitrosomonadaceae bacterium]|nr:dTDP-4-dehydrorhamnose 3,5-epimerase [Nitrosomonadaceae bacterium]|tara:strand:- start:549 stop:1094 length:546 start_codon:yes stop_codon:yes gene_type:complete
MKIIHTSIPEVLIIEPSISSDRRGFFLESFNEKEFCKNTGLNVHFVQDNHSQSTKGVLRGLHYQIQRPQGKLVRVVRGAVFDVVVDIRKSSPTFGKWIGTDLTESNYRQLWAPIGFAHGFLVLSDTADFLYKTTDYYTPKFERSILWNDPTIGIQWPLNEEPRLSDKDKVSLLLEQADIYP